MFSRTFSCVREHISVPHSSAYGIGVYHRDDPLT
jgi:hypothetical protein